MWALFAHTYVGVAYKKIIQSFDWWYVKPFYVFEINILRKIALCLWIYLHEKEYMAIEISNYIDNTVFYNCNIDIQSFKNM